MPRQKVAPSKPRVLAVIGTTSAGKTHLAVQLARRLGGEIVSADSRQVYKGLDVGTGKDLAEYGSGRRRAPYHLIDVADPRRQYNLARYQREAVKAIDGILAREKLPIVVGGSGLYLQALVDSFRPGGRVAPGVRKKWSGLDADGLYEEIAARQPEFARRINASDRHNRRRLERYLEIIVSGQQAAKRESPYGWLVIGLRCQEDELRLRIRERLIRRLEKEGLVAEVENLRQGGLSWQRLKSFGLEYKFVSRYLLGELSYPEMVERLDTALWRFAKRQLTWFRRWEKQGRQIAWIEDEDDALKQIKNWQ